MYRIVRVSRKSLPFRAASPLLGMRPKQVSREPRVDQDVDQEPCRGAVLATLETNAQRKEFSVFQEQRVCPDLWIRRVQPRSMENLERRNR